MLKVFKKIDRWDVYVNSLAAVIIIVSVKFILNETDFKYYSLLFSHLEPNIIALRFCFSVSLRIFLILSCLGVALRVNFFRKTMIAYAFFSVITVYWKHPYSTFEKIYTSLAQNPSSNIVPASIPIYASISVALNCALDIVIALLLVYLLTHKKILPKFKKAGIFGSTCLKSSLEK